MENKFKYLFQKSKFQTNLDFGFQLYNAPITVRFGLFGGIVIALINFPYKAFYSSTTDTLETYIGYLNEFPVLLIFLSIIISPLLEEFLFRAIVYRMIRNRVNIFWGYFISTALFTIGHDIFHLPYIIISSTILTILYERSRSIVTCFIAHAIWNVSWLIAALLS